jgi:branched-chain amino acid transport system permease protein
MRTDFVQAGEARLQYFEHGAGPELLVLVHGYRSSGRIWQLVQEALDASRFRSIAISNRGAGDSARTASEADYTVEAFARDLFAATQALGWRNFTLVGHSMGGATVTQYALDHPELLKALVLLNSAPLNGRTLSEDWEEQIRQEFATGAMAENMGMNAAHVPESFRQALRADVMRNPIERAMGGRRSMAGLRLRPRLHELAMPVLVVGGDQDTTVGVDNILAEYLALPPQSRFLHMFHDIGHSPNVEISTRFANLLDRFVSRTVPRSLTAGSSA